MESGLSDSNSEIEAIKNAILQLQNHKTLEEFAQVWQQIGLEPHHREDRRSTIVEHMGELLDEMLNEENLLKERMVESVRVCMQEMKQLEQELKLSTTHDDLDSKTLVEKERFSRSRVDALNKIKHDRMKRFKRLTEMEIALCKSLGVTSELGNKFQVQFVPSEDDLQTFRKRVELLESTKDSRQVEFRNTREKAIEIWEELEMSPTDEAGKQLQQGNVSKFVFSEKNMACLAEYYEKVQLMASEQEKRAEQLRNIIIPLWVRLEVPGVYREDYLVRHSGYKSWMIKELESELERLNELKKENLERFISTVREELNKFWDKCMFGETQRREFEPAFNDVYTDDALSAHESELDRISGFHADNVDVFKLVEKRETIWRQKLEMEARASDPNRLKDNRGGKLLQEQRQQQRLEKEYPKVEGKTKRTIEQWEEDHCRPFIIYDTRYLDKIDDEIQQHNSAREQEKTKRQQVKTETTMLEMRFGTKVATTPTPKRKAAACLTPGDKLAKVRKVEPSPLMKTNSAKNRITTNARTKKMTPSLRRRALRDRNIPSSCTTTTTTTTDSGNNSFVSNEISLASAGSYNDFQQGFIKVMENKRTARSSAIPKTSSVIH